MTDMPPLTVAVLRGDTPVFVLDEAGQVLPPEGAMRGPIALALAQAAAALAMVAPAPTPAEIALGLAVSLNQLGTPEAIAAIDALGTAAESQTAAMENATAVLQASMPTAH